MDQDLVQVIVEDAEVDAERRRKRTKLRLIVGLVALVLTSAVVGTIWGSYASASEDCASCHSDIHEQAQEWSHAEITCAECHVSTEPFSKTRFGATVLFGMRLHLIDPTGSPSVAVPKYRCTSCHEDLTGVLGNTIKIDHNACAPNQNCVTCHSQAAHLSEAASISMDMFECLNCHNGVNQTAECDTCHAGRVPQDRLKSGTFAVTHNTNWLNTHGMGSMKACSACHADNDCGKCHGVGVPHGYNFQLSHGEFGASASAQCQTCHTENFCNDCHGTEMPHPVGFKEVHAQTVTEQGKEDCMTCHAQSDCDTCHTMHIHPGGAVGAGDGQ